MNSGSAVSAPPRVASTGRWCFLAYSSTKGFCPGRWFGHLARLARHFHRGAARIRGHRHLIGELEAVGLDERLGQVIGVLDHVDVGEVVPVADEALRHRRLVAERETVATDPPSFQVRGLHHQHVAVPLAGREALPGVRRELGRVRPAVHPDLPLLLLPLDVGVQP
jgi:hypothetical protein